MNVQMVAQEFIVTPSLREHVERRLRFAFARTLGRTARIVVRLRDLNGPRGGRDKACQVSVIMPGSPEIVIREVQEDMYNAVDSAVKRAAYRVMRLMMRRRSVPRHNTVEGVPEVDGDLQ
jgi:ribosomal subunit interface protein